LHEKLRSLDRSQSHIYGSRFLPCRAGRDRISPSFIVIFLVDSTVSTLVPWVLFWRPVLFMKPALAPPAIWTGTSSSSDSVDHHSYQPPLTPTFVAPRSAPKPPSVRRSSIRAFQTVFHRKQPKSDISGNFSVVQSVTHSKPASINSNDPHPLRPAMHPAPLPVVSNKEVHEEEDCPVCLEPLSFSFRLPGEKPHIVPECGHALHEVSILRCNTAALYGLCLYFLQRHY
jgi:hypothetical protein